MDETVMYDLPVGRPPKLGTDGERLEKVAIKVYPSMWVAFGEAVGGRDRSELVRRYIERVVKRASRERLRNGKE